MNEGRFSKRAIWRERHTAALKRPSEGFERALVKLTEGWHEYAIAYTREFDGPVSGDYVLAPAWARVGQGILDLLNGPVGRLDCGTVDAALRESFVRHGFEEE